MKYPKRNGKNLTQYEKTAFDFFRSMFYANIKIIYGENWFERIEEKDMKTIAWNCAYCVITSDKYFAHEKSLKNKNK